MNNDLFRKTAKTFHIVGEIDRMRYEKFVDIIFDEFESRTCENCKHSRKVRSSRYNSIADARHCAILNKKVEDHFGCNKWLQKDD